MTPQRGVEFHRGEESREVDHGLRRGEEGGRRCANRRRWTLGIVATTGVSDTSVSEIWIPVPDRIVRVYVQTRGPGRAAGERSRSGSSSLDCIRSARSERSRCRFARTVPAGYGIAGAQRRARSSLRRITSRPASARTESVVFRNSEVSHRVLSSRSLRAPSFVSPSRTPRSGPCGSAWSCGLVMSNIVSRTVFGVL